MGEPPPGEWPYGARTLRALLKEPRRLKSIRDRPNAYWYAVGAVCIGAFMGQLDASIVTIAFPSFERAFHAGVGSVTWVGLSYLLALVAFVTIVGRFADMAGRKLLYVYGFAVFTLASFACALAPNLGALVGLRVVQGVGAAMLQANSLAIIRLAVPRGRLGRTIGVQGAAQALGLALGPSVGGALIAAGGWRLIFYV
ncbi:MAG TPA: MFS transporter, partial [Acidimicrobiales bacterium]|nr:MFS transporter [Acidimicrobiales bacterium]